LESLVPTLLKVTKLRGYGKEFLDMVTDNKSLVDSSDRRQIIPLAKAFYLSRENKVTISTNSKRVL
jgi:hypothetical protein